MVSHGSSETDRSVLHCVDGCKPFVTVTVTLAIGPSSALTCSAKTDKAPRTSKTYQSPVGTCRQQFVHGYRWKFLSLPWRCLQCWKHIRSPSSVRLSKLHNSRFYGCRLWPPLAGTRSRSSMSSWYTAGVLAQLDEWVEVGTSVLWIHGPAGAGNRLSHRPWRRHVPDAISLRRPSSLVPWLAAMP